MSLSLSLSLFLSFATKGSEKTTPCHEQFFFRVANSNSEEGSIETSVVEQCRPLESSRTRRGFRRLGNSREIIRNEVGRRSSGTSGWLNCDDRAPVGQSTGVQSLDPIVHRPDTGAQANDREKREETSPDDDQRTNIILIIVVITIVECRRHEALRRRGYHDEAGGWQDGGTMPTTGVDSQQRTRSFS